MIPSRPVVHVYQTIARDQRSKDPLIRLMDAFVTRPGGEPLLTAEVHGSTGLIYTITLDLHSCICSCPDYSRGAQYDSTYRCKHIYFVLRRVCQLRADEYTSRSFDINTPTVLAQAESFLEVRSQVDRKEESSGQVTRREVKDGDECCICFEPLSSSPTSWCQYGCGYSMHTNCIGIYHKTHARIERKCPLCRTLWFRVIDPGSMANS